MVSSLELLWPLSQTKVSTHKNIPFEEQAKTQGQIESEDAGEKTKVRADQLIQAGVVMNLKDMPEHKPGEIIPNAIEVAYGKTGQSPSTLAAIARHKKEDEENAIWRKAMNEDTKA